MPEPKEPKKRKHQGRKSICTPELTHKICVILANHNTVKTACQAVGINEASFYIWKEKGESTTSGPYFDFIKSVQEAQSISKMSLIKIIADAAPKDYRAAALLLKLLHPKEFTENPVQVEANVTVTASIETKQAIICHFPPVLATRPPRPRQIQLLDAHAIPQEPINANLHSPEKAP